RLEAVDLVEFVCFGVGGAGHARELRAEKRLRGIRGRRISMVMQDPKFSLNPVMTIGAQIAEAYRVHSSAGTAEAKRRALEML
ncbi:hypothetical protein SB763_34890, partial [Burkholderia sp. SIMBA_042]